MSVHKWLVEFKGLHERARKGQLDEEDKRLYASSKEQFARALTASQGLVVPSGQSARRTFRIAQGLQVDLSLDSGQQRAMTMDISVGGFSVMLHRPPAEGNAVGFSLRLPGNAEPLVGRARVVAAERRLGNHRVSFAFQELSEKDAERLELAMFDLAVARLR
ncbi:MAG TPA: PilZ domain-containing protein [Myxococcaceae bacterium]|nr:PilZ domain-containing protein [Myxococcaceae bacterium]